MITRDLVMDKLVRYLNGQISLAELVDWAENALAEAEVPPEEAEVISSALARLGLADVRAFGLTWEDAQEILASLGYRTYVEAKPA